jgi:putative nucleotidyltransferase with HDIG domain
MLGGIMLIFAALLSFTAIWASNRYIEQSTVSLTETAVQDHFTKLPQFAPIFHGQQTPGDTAGGTAADAHADHGGQAVYAADSHADHGGQAVYAADSHADHSGQAAYAADAHADHGGQDSAANSAPVYDYDTLYAVVRLHFDIYTIVASDFYGLDGTIRFSYEKSELGQKVNSANEADWRTAAGGGVDISRPGAHMLQLWMPITEDGKPIGVASIRRDISLEEKQAQRIQLMLLAIIVFGAIVLFFALRQVFLRSARVIARQHAEVASLLERVERTYDESLKALTSALDYRDNETQGHSLRVTSYALLLGRRMGLSEEQLDHLARGALLHDVGKIGVPDAILLKPGKLDEQEWAIMRSHVQLGFDMLQHIEFLQPSLDVVRYHHERWDGQGYPYRKEGEDIPLFARIFALCDTYDAMTSDRPYRKGLGYEAARAEIERCCGTQYSPDVVAAFLEIDKAEWTAVQAAAAASKIETGSSLKQTAAAAG